MNKRTQIDALRGERIWDTMFDWEEKIWLERFFARVAPWVDTAEQGDQELSGLALLVFSVGRGTVLAMAEGSSAYDGWETWLFRWRQMISPGTGSKEVEARKKQLSATKRTPMPRQRLASRIRSLTSAQITQMFQTEAPAFAAAYGFADDGFGQFIIQWSFRAGALVTIAIAEGKETRAVIDQPIEDAFAASGGKFEHPNDEI